VSHSELEDYQLEAFAHLGSWVAQVGFLVYCHKKNLGHFGLESDRYAVLKSRNEVTNQTTIRNNPSERKTKLHRGESLEFRIMKWITVYYARLILRLSFREAKKNHKDVYIIEYVFATFPSRYILKATRYYF
jgi:hypothetical protein